MLVTVIYVFAVVLEFIFLISFIVYVAFLIYSNLKGSPYVPTSSKEADFILKETGLKKGQFFVELGSGDGRLVRNAVKDYGVKALGVDVNPLLIWYSKFLAKIRGLKVAWFKTEDMFRTDLTKADVLYLFLMPGLLERLTPKLERELKKNTLVISHGFSIPGFKKKLEKTIHHSPFPTYFYRL